MPARLRYQACNDTMCFTLAADGTLDILQNNTTRLKAIREADAKKAALPEPTDSEAHTRVKDPSQPLLLTFPDIDGNPVSLSDGRFKRS